MTETVDPATGEVKDDQFGLGAYSVACALRKNNKAASRNGLTYELLMEVQPGRAEDIVGMFTGDSPRLYWQPEGAEKPTLISYGAGMPKYTIALDQNDDAERHDTMLLRLTAGDIAIGTAVLEGPWASSGAGQPINGILTIDPAQLTAGL